MFRVSRYILIAAFGFTLPNQAYLCELFPEQSYVSLSGPVTHLLEEFSLLEDSSLKAISIFHPTGKFKVKKVAGGIFMSPKFLKMHKSSVVFYDESRELSRALKQNGMGGAIEVKTRGMDPFEANAKALVVLEPHLKNCSAQIKQLKKSLEQAKLKIKKITPRNKAYVFYLGKFLKNQRPPELLIVNDGFVKYLKDHLEMKTYPGELGYVPWSERELEKLAPFIKLGIHETEAEKLKIEKIGDRVYNVGAKGALSPGLKQVRFLEKLADSNLFKKAR